MISPVTKNKTNCKFIWFHGRCNNQPNPCAVLANSSTFLQPKLCTSLVCTCDVRTILTIGTTCSGGERKGNIMFVVEQEKNYYVNI